MRHRSMSTAVLLACALTVPVGAPAFAGPTTSAVAVASATTGVSASVAAAKKKPRAVVTATYTTLATGKVQVQVSSNAARVQVKSRTSTDKKRTVNKKLKKGAATVTLPAGSKSITVRAKATKKLAASPWATATPPTPPAVTPPVVTPPVVAPPVVTPPVVDPPVTPPAVTAVPAIAAGGAHSCVLLPTGHVRCWGWNTDGQAGNGGFASFQLSPVDVGISNAVGLDVGGAVSCAVLTDGQVTCWGANWAGQLGNGLTSEHEATPSTVLGIDTAKAISVGDEHVCALLADGRVSCWGRNSEGQLGNGVSSDPLRQPVLVPGISNAIAVSAGGTHTCAVLSTGHITCWGDNSESQLGDGTSTSRPTPGEVVGLSSATALSAGRRHTCARLVDGTVTCWGWNSQGEMGNGTSGGTQSTPTPAAGIATAVSVSSGDFHTCALLADARVKCWGWGVWGQLGNGATNNSATPVDVNLATGAVSIGSGQEHTCALLNSGQASCWGSNSGGQLGDGTYSDGGGTGTPRNVVGIP